MLPAKRTDSGGAHFFVCVPDPPTLTGKYTVFGRGREGRMSSRRFPGGRRDAGGGAGVAYRDCLGYHTRDASARARAVPTETVAELSQYARCSTRVRGRSPSRSSPTRRPATCAISCGSRRRGCSTHVRAPRGSAVLRSDRVPSSRGPLTEKQQKLVRELAAEFTTRSTSRGWFRMARGDYPGSATTSFFIVTGERGVTRRKYTAFGRVR